MSLIYMTSKRKRIFTWHVPAFTGYLLQKNLMKCKVGMISGGDLKMGKQLKEKHQEEMQELIRKSI